MQDELTLTDVATSDISARTLLNYFYSRHKVVCDYATKIGEALELIAEGEEREAEKQIYSANALYGEAVYRSYRSATLPEDLESPCVGTIACDTWRGGDCDNLEPSKRPSKRVELMLAYLEHLADTYESVTGETFDHL